MKRGDVWIVAGGPDYVGKPRPAVIVQDMNFEDLTSITVCGFTTVVTDAPLMRPELRPSQENGLQAVSHVLVDKITTIPRSKLGVRIGELAEQDMLNVDQAMLVFLGLARRSV